MKEIKEVKTEPILVNFDELDLEDKAIIDIELRISAISCAGLIEFGIDEIADYVSHITTQANLDLAVTQRNILSTFF